MIPKRYLSRSSRRRRRDGHNKIYHDDAQHGAAAAVSSEQPPREEHCVSCEERREVPPRREEEGHHEEEEEEGGASDAAGFSYYEGARAKDRSSSGSIISHYHAGGIPGTVGPGAEPPVAVASHAFAHEGGHTVAMMNGRRRRSIDHIAGAEPPSTSCQSSAADTAVGRINITGMSQEEEEKEEATWARGQEVVRAGSLERHCAELRRRRRCSGSSSREDEDEGGDNACCSSGYESTVNKEDVDTLPDTFDPSDECGPEGAPTGRRGGHHDDADDDNNANRVGPPQFICPPADARRRRRKQIDGQAATTNTTTWRESSSRSSRTRSSRKEGSTDSQLEQGGEEEDEEGGGEEVSSVSEPSECWSPASPRRQRKPQNFGRGIRRPSRRPLVLLTTTKKNSTRISPSEGFLVQPSAMARGEGERGGEGEGEGRRRQRRKSSSGTIRYRAPPLLLLQQQQQQQQQQQLQPWGGSGGRRRRPRSRSRCVSLAGTEPESVRTTSTEDRRFEAEMARLRKENRVLKQQQERSRRLSGDVSEASHWSRFEDDLEPRQSQSSRSRQRDLLPTNARQPQQERLAKLQQHDRRSRSHSCVPGLRVADESSLLPPRARGHGHPSHTTRSSWSDFVSNSHLSPQSTQGAARIVEPEDGGGVDLWLPRVLVEGGFLWKIPYHNSGTPKRRWFQIKSAEGLLVTAGGRLVVRPTAADGGGGGGAGEVGLDRSRSFGERSDDDGDGGRTASSTSMMRIRATWPLTLVWVDPERNLNRYPPREMEIGEIVDIARGHKTPAFWQQAAHRGIHTLPAPELCFSLMGHQRTLDLAAESMLEAKTWVRALADVALRVKRGGITAGGGFDDVVSSPLSQTESIPARSGYKHHDDKAAASQRSREEVGPTNTSARGPQKKLTSGEKEKPADEAYGNSSSRVSNSNPRPEKRMTAEGETWSVETVRSWRRRLFPAVSRGDAGTVSALFDQGCPVDLAQVGTGDTPLLLACRLGNIGIVGECLRRGSKNDPHPDFGQTALHAAVASGQEACTRLLLETASPSRSDAVVSNHKDPNEDTPLHIACRRGYGGIVEALLHHGADLGLVDREGGTPMHGAAGAGHAGALASLLDAGGDAVLEEKNRRGDRALHSAAASGHIACVELLLGTAAEPDTPNAEGKTPFALASIGGHLAVTRLIRQYAPAAGTPSGGDALNRSDRKGNGGRGSANADTLPRPHGSSSSPNCPGTPEYRSQNLEDRCYSAARLGHRRFGVSGESLATPGAPETGVGGSASNQSLFDGLQVYVVGGRQPLGSQQGSSAGGTVFPTASTTSSLNDSTRGSSQQSHQQMLLRQEGYCSSQQESLSSPLTQSFSAGAMTLNGGQVLSAPSTVAPTPPTHRDQAESSPSAAFVAGSEGDSRNTRLPPPSTVPTALSENIGKLPTGSPPSTAAVPGSARALARMIYFSNRAASASVGGHALGAESERVGVSEPMRTVEAEAGEVLRVGGGTEMNCVVGGREAPGEAVGSWMTSRDQEGSVSIGVGDVSGGKCGDGRVADKASVLHDSAAAATISLSEFHDDTSSGTSTMMECVAASGKVQHQEGAESDGTGRDSFVITSSGAEGLLEGGGAALEGFWRVFHSQGFPYYLHEASGHSQWDDPRHRQGSSPIEGSQGYSEVEEGAATAAAVAASVEVPPPEDGERRPASPIKPVGVSVAVEVSPFADATVSVFGASKQDADYNRTRAARADNRGEHTRQIPVKGLFDDGAPPRRAGRRLNDSVETCDNSSSSSSRRSSRSSSSSSSSSRSSRSSRNSSSSSSSSDSSTDTGSIVRSSSSGNGVGSTGNKASKKSGRTVDRRRRVDGTTDN